ncbi:bifunctional 2-polyprenyl-6-hydroxyphenol methylase/3-demethylubiquinol 3-O-methyltransferase UbiG [uncultured Thiohalocapsa sp.]|uniref:class I SAM-dependent methyltransferase n=1 Tax=uncultured Thiohalocapsa sp. TaxID=768990 RepID=UPI0025F28417|nr:class I SAM-dependent methyltransferase [uncultured Thiohalocapsa sp.]
MSAFHHDNGALDIDALVAALKREAQALDGEDVPDAAAAAMQTRVAAVPAAQSAAREVQLADLLRYEGEAFLDKAYSALLGRPLDEAGRGTYGADVTASGHRSWVLTNLLWSAEARARGVRLHGLEWMRPLRRLPGKRLMRLWLRLRERRLYRRRPQFAAALEAQRLRERLTSDLAAQADSFEQKIAHQAQHFDHQLAMLRGDLQTAQARLDRQDDRIQSQADRQDEFTGDIAGLDQRLNRLVREYDFARSDMLYHRSRMFELMRELRAGRDWSAQAPSVEPAAAEPGAPTDAAAAALAPEDIARLHRDDALEGYYVAFMDAFRGDRQDIEAGQSIYLEALRAAGTVTAHTPALDIACGRGEWLDLLASAGLPAVGLDSNPALVEQCRERGMDVRRGDAVHSLAAMDDASVGAITAFHLAEHLPFPQLFGLVQHAHRVLVSGGLLILETPNPENLLVAGHTFYHDPTHRNPLTPTAMCFLLRYSGFAEPQVERLHPYPESARLPGTDPASERLNGLLCGPQDFALIARKP